MRWGTFHRSSVLGAFGLFGVACGFSGVGAATDAVDRPDGTVSLVDGSVLQEAGADAPSEAGFDAAICESDTSSDPKNCGACGHDCMGGTCVAGRCQPVGVGAATEPNAQGLFVDKANVYWTNTGPGGQIKRCSVAGCGGTPTLLAANLASPNAVLASGTGVYWTNYSGYTLMSCAIGGCSLAPTTLATVSVTANSFGRLASDGVALFFSNGGSGIIRSCPLAPARTARGPWPSTPRRRTG